MNRPMDPDWAVGDEEGAVRTTTTEETRTMPPPPPPPAGAPAPSDAWVEERQRREVTPARRVVPGEAVVTRDLPAVDDRVRWGPIWGGFVVALAVFALLQLLFFATEASDLDLNPSAAGTTRSTTFWTILAAGIGFFIGGVVAGMAAKWRRLGDGLVQGVVLWALITVALVIASGFALGTLSSSVGGSAARLVSLRDAFSSGGTPASSDMQTARDAAGNACIFLGITLGAAVLGALIGAKLWPPRRRTVVDDRL